MKSDVILIELISACVSCYSAGSTLECGFCMISINDLQFLLRFLSEVLETFQIGSAED